MTGRLEGKVAIITGGASGIGAAMARRFVNEGAKVVIIDLPSQASAAEKLVSEMGNRARFFSCDVTNAGECTKAVKFTQDQFGVPRVLVNNAGIAVVGGVEELSEDDWDRQFDVNVKSIYLMSRPVVPLMRQAGGGSIINIASESAFIAFPMHPAYCASKAAVMHLSRSMGVRYATDKIRVNALCPGTIDTPLYRSFLSKQADPDAVHKTVLAMHPLGLGTPEDIAAAALYLASDESKYVTAAPMHVDGGSTAM
jgi:NAD(P)-dependent dehydrogenase (short-subunit alcohol dehydrogenase family)